MTTSPDISAAQPQTPERDLVLVEDRDDYAVMTINRPEKRNAMNSAAQRRFRASLAETAEKAYHHLQGLGWDAAMEYSTYTRSLISHEQGAHATAGLDRFAAGHRGSGQGGPMDGGAVPAPLEKDKSRDAGNEEG